MKHLVRFLLCILLLSFQIAISAENPLLLIKGSALERAKSKPQLYQPAISQLVKEADKMMQLVPPSVMDKTAVPPSGDKHDYYSQARYWFPDPTQPDGLPYIRKDGVNNPDIKELDRDPLAKMSRAVSILAAAYYFTSDQAYADKAWSFLRVWFLNKKSKMNPHLEYGQVVLGRNNNKGRGEGILDTYSLVTIPDAVTLLSSSGQTKKGDIEALKSWFSTYLDWILSSEQGTEESAALNNHAVAYDIQVVCYALFTGKKETALSTLKNFAQKRIFTQIEPDGRQPRELIRTTAFGYSVFNLTHFLDMVQIGQQQGIDLYGIASKEGCSIEKAIDFLVPYIGQPVTSWPYQQIRDWDKVQQSLCWVLYRADQLAPDKGYKKLFDQWSKAKNSDRNFLWY